VTIRSVPLPAFGQADLSNCEREQIHLAGSIQPHGVLLLVRETDGVILQASANAREFLKSKDDLLGRSLQSLGGDLANSVAAVEVSALRTSPITIRCRLQGEEFDALVHSPPEGGLIVELERASGPIDFTQSIARGLQAIVTASTLRSLCEDAASIFKDLTGYDRVMVYRFDDDGHGEVFSERREPQLEAYLGNRYPASDIPQIARRLYERTRVRVLVDVSYDPIPLTPRLCPTTGRDLDMSLCILRSMSPIHIQYLKNMGVRATLVASLVVGGKLWGLVACHHYTPRTIPFEMRAACEILSEAIAIRVAALESFAQAQAELSVRRLEQRMVEAISQDGDWRVALFDNSQSLLQPLGATGAALLLEGQILTAGDVPGTQELREIADWLDQRRDQPVIATASLGFDDAKFESILSVASGLVATPVSSSAGEYLIWFRPERIRLVTWGGDPLEPVLIGDNPSDLSPRRSFAKWHQLVEGKCEPWTQADLTTARLIGETVTDVVLQFRSVRMLIARDQLEKVTGQVQVSELPVIIADSRGRILIVNQAFEQLLAAAHPHLEWIEDLAPSFSDADGVRQRMRDLVDFRRTWRGEMTMLASNGQTRSVVIRGDPIFVSPDRMLGIVLLFTDVADQAAGKAAGRGFEESFFDGPRVPGISLETKADLVYQRLLSSLMENAQLAALEITEGVDKSQMTQMLDGVRTSVDRSALVLDHLIRHSIGARKVH
jgi:two-component system, chemotaxis family, sensor kinase Cph1